MPTKDPAMPSPAASLSSLPTEILIPICLELDVKSALSLALVARAFTAPAERRIWRDIDLFVSPHYGEYPLILPPCRDGDDGDKSWSRAEAGAASARHAKAVKEKARNFTVAADVRRIDLIQSVTVVPRTGAIYAILALLDLVSPKLKSLTLTSSSIYPHTQNLRPSSYDLFDVKAIDYGLYFGCLTTLHIDYDSIRYSETVILLCQASPNLVSLTVDMRQGYSPPIWLGDSIVPHPPTKEATINLPKLRYLDISVPGDDDDNPDDVVRPFLTIISSSPLLERFSLRSHPDDLDLGKMVQRLAVKPHLTDVQLHVMLEELSEVVSKDDTDFPALRRLVLASAESLNLFELFGFWQLPNLEIVHIDPLFVGTSIMRHSPDDLPPATMSYAMLPTFAQTLRNNPRLAHMNSLHGINTKGNVFDALEGAKTKGSPIAIFNSYLHAGQELLHARVYSHYVQVADTPLPNPDRRIGIDYVTADGQERRRIYERRAEAAWQDFADFEGCHVSLEIIQEMREAQGASVEKWQGRGVEVGDEAWKVLTGWCESRKTEIAEEM